jgi:hypothetical protein
MADGPASLLPDGTILTATSPVIFQNPVTFFIFNGTTFTEAPPTQSSGSLTSYQERFLLLPTGQVLSLVADGSTIDEDCLAGAACGLPRKSGDSL